MPQIGEMVRGFDLGKTNWTRWHWYIWAACPDCGKERWANLKRRYPPIPLRDRCHLCACRTPEKRLKSAVNKEKKGSISPAWKGGRYISGDGYVMVYLPEDSFFVSMRAQGIYVREHRLVVAQQLNRCLLPWEVVHHKNGIKVDNRLENLELLGVNSKHNSLMNKEIKRLQEENTKLKACIRELENEDKANAS